MIPGGSVLRSTELVGKLLARRNRALSDSIDSVHFCIVELTNTMPVDCRPIEPQVITNSDFQLVAPACLDWTRKVASVLPHVEVTDGDYLEYVE